MYHIVFVHSSANGCLGFFHGLAVINSAAMNIGLHVYFQCSFLQTYSPRSGITGSYDSTTFKFLRISILFSKMVVPICIPTNRVGGFPLVT